MKFFSSLLFCLIVISVTYADERQLSISVLSHPWFSRRLPQTLECLVLNRGSKSNNHFFISPVEARDNCDVTSAQDGCIRKDAMMPIVYWQETGEIILFEPLVSENPFTDLLYSRRTWRFGKDTVKRPVNISGSSYLETEDTWKKWRTKAIAGTSFNINKEKIYDLDTSCTATNNN